MGLRGFSTFTIFQYVSVLCTAEPNACVYVRATQLGRSFSEPSVASLPQMQNPHRGIYMLRYIASISYILAHAYIHTCRSHPECMSARAVSHIYTDPTWQTWHILVQVREIPAYMAPHISPQRCTKIVRYGEWGWI